MIVLAVGGAVGCTISRVPVVTTSPSGEVTTNYVKHAELAPYVEPVGDAVGAPWGLQIGAIAASIGGLFVALYNKRQLKKHIGEETAQPPKRVK